MTERKRFIATGLSWSGGKVVIPREGMETDDPGLIAFLTKHRDFGNFFHAVPTKAELEAQSKAYARVLLQDELDPNAASVTVAVEPLAAPDPEQERALLEQEQKIREEQAAAEAQAEAERKAKNNATREKIANKRGRKPANAGSK